MNSKEIIKKIFNNDNLLFNKDFEKYFNNLKEEMRKDLIKFCEKVINEEIEHIPITNKKFRNHILFIDKIADKRIMVVKIKNSDYIEIHLSDHKYYDLQRKRFGIKKGSNYY